MKIFNIQNIVNPELVYGSLLSHKNKIYRVTNIDNEFIFITNENSENLKIKNEEWEPIPLDKNWLSRLNIEIGSKIKNIKTGIDYQIKLEGKRFIFIGDNGSKGTLDYVHDLQRLYFDLKNKEKSSTK